GGTGMVIVEITCVDHPLGIAITRQLAADDDKYLPGLSELADAIKRHGARAVLQLHHAGRESHAENLQPVAPSAVTLGVRGARVPRELTIAEIQGLVQKFAGAAARAKKAGFDAVEIHGAHYYLIGQFLSPASNQRKDAYGGNVQNRARFLLEVIEAVRAAVGKDYPMWARLNGREFGIQNGLTLEDGVEIARMAQQAGVDMLHISAWGMGEHAALPSPFIPGELLPLAEAVKKVATVPVMAVGRLNVELAEKALAEGKADLVSIGRGLICDPELANKAASGRADEIVPCIACLKCGDAAVNKMAALRCSVNPAAGREAEFVLKPASRSKRVLVVGGGPAGMEAARLAAMRGHRVLIYEKNDGLGGQLLPAAAPPGKDDIGRFAAYLTGQVRKYKINVELNSEVTPALVQELKPDAIVVATGIKPAIPPITGLSTSGYVTAEDVLTGKAQTGDRVAIIGGGIVGCETAEYLADKGRKVAILEMMPKLATGMVLLPRWLLLKRISAKGIRTLVGVKVEEAARDRVTFVGKDGKKEAIEVDSIVLAAGAKANNDLYQQIKGSVPEVYLVGDAREPCSIIEAIGEAARVGYDI
ncbi:MAG: FAD-dependent oxidoreductase, partial [Dehalococcoidia bacterium]|nr:FAD-dependent oxidoreductase [Dehalococcoidia bacterium]